MIIEIILLIAAVPIGLFIARLAKDELKDGSRWFRLLVSISLSLSILSLLFGKPYQTLTLIFIAIVSFLSFTRSKKDYK